MGQQEEPSLGASDAEACKTDQAAVADPTQISPIAPSEQVGALLGEAACLFADAHQKLIAGLLRLEIAQLEVSPEISTAVHALGELAFGSVSAGDDYGRAEVARRFGCERPS